MAQPVEFASDDYAERPEACRVSRSTTLREISGSRRSTELGQSYARGTEVIAPAGGTLHPRKV